MPFSDNMFNKVFIRNAVYEVPKKDQVKLYKEILRVLKKEGLFINWTVKLNEKNQEAFQKLANKKDEIAEFDELVKNRYFMTEAELKNYLKNAGFSSVDYFDLGINYILQTKKWFEVDFKRDKTKYEKMNKYIKSIKNISGIEIEDLGKKGFNIKVLVLISIARKK